MDFEIHATQVESHQGCPRRWYLLSYLKKEPKSPEAALQLGRLIHAAFDLHYYKGTPLQTAWFTVVREEMDALKAISADGTLWESELEKITKQTLLGLDMLEAYADWQTSSGDEYSDSNLIFLDTEQTFRVEEDGITFAGRFDGLVQQRSTGQIFVLENKTCSSIERTRGGIYWDYQPLMYLWAAQQMNPLVLGILYTFIRKTSADVPLLQNGLPSKAVRSKVQCTAQRYMRVLEECIEGLTDEQKDYIWKDYQDEIEYLMYEAPPLVARHLYIPTPELLLSTLRIVKAEAVRMRQTVEGMKKGVLPTPHKNRFRCPSCSARSVCYAMDTGADWETILEDQFVPARYYERLEDSD